MTATLTFHDDIIKWNHFPHCWSFVRVTGGFSSQRPVTQSFDVFFDVRLNNWLSKQSRCQWFKMPSGHHNVIVAYQCFQYWYDSHINSIVHKLNCYTRNFADYFKWPACYFPPNSFKITYDHSGDESPAAFSNLVATKGKTKLHLWHWWPTLLLIMISKTSA